MEPGQIPGGPRLAVEFLRAWLGRTKLPWAAFRQCIGVTTLVGSWHSRRSRYMAAEVMGVIGVVGVVGVIGVIVSYPGFPGQC